MTWKLGGRNADGAAAATPPKTVGAPAERGRIGRPWNLILPIAFVIGAESSILHLVVAPQLLGSHAWIYTDAARALLAGSDPWRVGPAAVVFAGPPTMLLPFVPFAGLPNIVIAGIWVLASLIGGIWLLRKLGLPGYWLAFNPLLAAIGLGHPEVLAVALLFLGGRLGGLSAIVKPYMGFALLAQRRWSAIAVAIIAVAITAPFLPWGLFIQERDMISQTLAQQYSGDSVFGNPVLMLIAVVALASLGWRRALWLGTPLLWPFAQQTYKLMALPVLTPVIAVFWAVPVPGFALIGVVLQAVLERVDDRRPLPTWLRAGIQPLTDMGADVWPRRRQARRTVGAALPAAATVAT